MTIIADIQQLPVSQQNKEDPFYRKLEIIMQGLGHLTAFRETLNWDRNIDTIELGETEWLDQLKKTAAKNDGVPLFYAKWFKKTIYEHLILHPNNQGFYLPFHFEGPFYIEFKGKRLWVGSSPRLLEELGWLELTMEGSQPPELVAMWEAYRGACRKSRNNMSPFLLRTE